MVRTTPNPLARCGSLPLSNHSKRFARSWTVSAFRPVLLPSGPPHSMMKAHWNGLELLPRHRMVPSSGEHFIRNHFDRISVPESSMAVSSGRLPALGRPPSTSLFVTSPDPWFFSSCRGPYCPCISLAGAKELPHTRPISSGKGPLILPIRMLRQKKNGGSERGLV